ncbi:MAG: hypothetical protein ACXWLM_09680 [Myxococcales bacterium]
MEHRTLTIFEVAEKAAKKQRSEPEAGQRKLKAARKASGRTSHRAHARPKGRRAAKRRSR